MDKKQKTIAATENEFLDGQLLIAMPLMNDHRFARSVIYLCAHSEEGAMGLIINQSASNISFPDLLSKLEVEIPSNIEVLPDEVGSIPVHVGGPVETGRGFVLHTADYFAEETTLAIDDQMCLTATIDILKAMADGEGPEQAILALGYAGWSAGQLEEEIHANGWLNCPADPDIIFKTDTQEKYSAAMARIGIDPSHLVADAGHA
ncbi:MAG: YqgE/AlgH family protein [Hyphomicrobiaceae bacterium]